jgi:hypothetical protein
VSVRLASLSVRRLFFRFLVVGLAISLIPVYPVHAASDCGAGHGWTGRCPYTGYFSGEYVPRNNVCPYSAKGNGSCNGSNNGTNFVLLPDKSCAKNRADAIPTECVAGSGSDTTRVNSLIQFLKNYSERGDELQHSSAGFIFQTLVGRDGAEADANDGRNIRPSTSIPNFGGTGWDGLESLIDQELADGQITIDWNTKIYSPVSSYAMYIVNEHNGDVGLDNGSGGQNDKAIIFRDKAGRPVYILYRLCANPGGDLNGLPTLNKPAPKPTCGGMTIDPGQPDPKMRYKVTANVDYQDTNAATTVRTSRDNLFIHVNGPGVSYNNDNVGVSQSGRRLSGWVQPGPTNHTGTYNVDYGISGPDPGTITCRDSFYVTDQPVFHTSGGDTDTGAGMTIGGVDCAVPADPKAGLVGWNLEAKGNYAGAGTQYAAFAMNHLQDYATAQDGTAGGPYTSSDPTMLAFANDAAGGVNVGAGLFGGQFGGGSACVRDYFSGATGVLNGNITIGGRAIANSTSQAIYVKGNVYITGDITFSDSYANIGEIPSFNVIVEGNIYIAPGVKQLDGLYVAEPTTPTRGGIVYTCASAPFVAQPLDSGLYNKCSGNSLTFNGAVVARQLWLLRANGTVSDSGTAAENVNFTPEIWLTTPPDVITGNGAAGTYNAITSLPPVL